MKHYLTLLLVAGITVPISAASAQDYVEHIYEVPGGGIISTSHNNPQGFENLDRFLRQTGTGLTAMDYVDKPLPAYLIPTSPEYNPDLFAAGGLPDYLNPRSSEYIPEQFDSSLISSSTPSSTPTYSANILGDNPNARAMYERYGTSDGSSYAEALQRQTIYGYGTPIPAGGVPGTESSSPTGGSVYSINPNNQILRDSVLGTGVTDPAIRSTGMPVPETDRNLTSADLLGEPFEVLADGTRLFETEGAPVGLKADGSIVALNPNNQVIDGAVLGRVDTSSGMIRNSQGYAVGGTIRSVLNRFTSLGQNSGTVSSSRSASNSTRNISPISFTNRNSSSVSGGVSRYQAANGDYSGARYRNNGMGNGFSLALSPERVRQNRQNFPAPTGNSSGAGGLSLLRDATNGDGTFMGQQTGNVFQGNFTGFSGATATTSGASGSTATTSSTGTATRSSGIPTVETRPVERPSTYATPNSGPQ